MKNMNNLKIDLQVSYEELTLLGALCKMALDSNNLEHQEYVLIRAIMEKLTTTGTLFLKNQYSNEELQSYLDSKGAIKN